MISRLRISTRRKVQRGMSMIEVVMASAILAVVGTAMLMLIQQLTRAERKLRLRTAEDRLVESLMTNIRTNLHLYQTSSRPASAAELAGNAEEDQAPPMSVAFSENDFTSVDSCPTCPGRMGFSLKPMPGMASLYLVTMRVSHREIYGEGTIRQYRFIATMK